MVPEYVLKPLDKIAHKLGFTDYKFESNAGSSAGDNFAGLILRITLIGTRNQNGKSGPDTLHLICKIPPENENRREMFKTDIIFERELFVYAKLLPLFSKFQREKGLNEDESFTSYPNVYYCEADEKTATYILIMEDLREKNYRLWPKNKSVPLDHELLVMKELGKFHAISFALKDQRPEEFAPFKLLDDKFSAYCKLETVKIFWTKTLERAVDALTDPMHKKLALEFSKSYADELSGFFSAESSEPFGIVGHGDCWNNNFLYKYDNDEEQNAKAVSFLDWQIARYCSPAFDLLYNIFSGTDKAFRAVHYEDLLKAYHSSLTETIRKLGSDPERLFSYENFQNQMKKFGRFAMLTGPMIIQIRFANAGDLADMNESAELIKDLEGETQEKYSKEVNDLFTDLVNYGYI